jgi:hypothetical protein
VIKSSRIKSAGNVTSMGEVRTAVENPGGKNHLGDLDVDGKIVLKRNEV